MLKKILFSIIGIFLVVVILCVFGEIVLRLLKGVPESPLAQITQGENQHFLFEPNQDLHSTSSVPGEFEYTAHINKYGYRGKDFLREKLKGVTRVMTVGDSFTFGVGASKDETFAALLEKGLTQRGLPVEVINAGIGHASTVRHWDNLLKIHLQYDPDVILLFFDMTDLWDDWHWERHAVWDKKAGRIKRFDLDFYGGKRNWWATLVHKSALCKYLENKVVRTWKKLQLLGLTRYLKATVSGERAKAIIINSKDEFPDDVVTEYDALLMMRGRQRKELIDKHWKRTALYLKKIHELLSERGISLVIVMYPHGIYVGPDQWNEGREAWGFEKDKQYTDYYPFELMEEFTRQEGIPFINTLPGFLSAPKDKYFYDFDGHMRPKGNKIVVQQILSNPKFLKTLKR